MKAQIEAQGLRQALQYARLVFKRRAPLYITQGVIHLECVSPDTIQLTATNLEVAFKAKLPAATTEEGAILLPCWNLLRFIGKEDWLVKITADSKPLTVVEIPDIEGIARFKDTRLWDSTDEFADAVPNPDNWLLEETIATEVSAQWFCKIAKWIVPYAATEESRPILTGILLEESNMIAADGFRMILIQAPKELQLAGATKGKSIIIPATTLTLVSRVFAKSEKQMPDFSYETWGIYYDNGYTPQAAFDEDLSQAD